MNEIQTCGIGGMILTAAEWSTYRKTWVLLSPSQIPHGQPQVWS